MLVLVDDNTDSEISTQGGDLNEESQTEFKELRKDSLNDLTRLLISFSSSFEV
jgi:hypothetical protein